jgi:hypothetical protein
MIVTPGNLVGLPVGIWSLVVLSQRRVRSCFGKERPLGWRPAAPAPAGSSAWKVAAAIVAGILLVCAIPVGALVVAMTLPALHRAKAASEYNAQFGPAQKVTLSAVKVHGPVQALDLDNGQVADLPAEVRQESRVVNWFAERGLDLTVSREEGSWALVTAVTNQLRLSPVPKEAWLHKTETDPPKALFLLSDLKEGNALWTTERLSSYPELPVTFAFKTANGARGLLRVTGLDETADCATLEFKLRK